MDQLLIVLGFSAADAIQAERLLDYIAILNLKQPRGHCLLVAAPDTHGETQTKMKIAAEVAFESVELLAVPWPAVAHTSKAEAVNHLWYSAMTHAARCYQWPSLWIEPDCVPLRNSWVGELEAAYYDQPRRYLGSILSSQDGKMRHLSRVAVYPRGAGGEMKELCAGKTPFELAAGGLIVPRAGKTKLIQKLRFKADTDRSAIRDTAVLVHGDKEAVLLSALIDEASKPRADDGYHRLSQLADATFTENGPNPKLSTWIDGAPVMSPFSNEQIKSGGLQMPPPATAPRQPITDADVKAAMDGSPPPRDKRTKEYKEWLAERTKEYKEWLAAKVQKG